MHVTKKMIYVPNTVSHDVAIHKSRLCDEEIRQRGFQTCVAELAADILARRLFGPRAWWGLNIESWAPDGSRVEWQAMLIAPDNGFRDAIIYTDRCEEMIPS